MRLGPNLLSFDNPALLPEVYHRNVEKTPFYSTGLAGEKAPLLQIQSHDAHKEQLKALAPSVSRSFYTISPSWLTMKVLDAQPQTTGG